MLISKSTQARQGLNLNRSSASFCGAKVLVAQNRPLLSSEEFAARLNRVIEESKTVRKGPGFKALIKGLKEIINKA